MASLPPRVFRYEQKTGAFYDLRTKQPHFMGNGYSGKGFGLNNPVAQDAPRAGPIPVGRYRIKASRTHPTLGPVSIPLEPTAETFMHGRSGFYIHGDNRRGDKSASSGCIILGRVIRDLVARAAATREGAFLEVVSGDDIGVVAGFERIR